ncbi:MAG TPA: sulfite exporter TauE/SafE family protein [Bacteroidales bacterium]|nr:sulfite exporter TauE/SafE family protein [Bacteroidales bacterium]
MEYLSALVLGLLGSFHCMGMCGPIAIALPLKTHAWPARIGSSLLYNIGRTVTYGILGFIFGLIGKGFSLGGLQQWVSITLGIIMLVSVAFPLFFRRINLERSAYAIVSRLKGRFSKMFSIRSYSSLFTIGILNGFLPCGLVYIALAGAIVSGEITDGVLYMMIFGLGTIPAMALLSILGNVISVKFRKKISKLIPVFIVIIGILFILRGMNLGIKYISPKLNKEDPAATECCH